MAGDKESTRRALERYFKRAELERTKSERARAPNKAPEKDVERACMKWMKSQGWDVAVFESKAKLLGGEWRQSGAKFGTCDCQGLASDGSPVFIEFKAPGKRSTFWREGNERQQKYLLSKLDLYAFAVVIDSQHLLESTWATWQKLKHDPFLARAFLREHLPPKPAAKEILPLF